MLTVGLGGVIQHGCVALTEAGRLRGVCRQERISRVRNEGFATSGLANGALDALLDHEKASRKAIGRIVVAEPIAAAPSMVAIEQMDHQEGHAAAAYLSSSDTDATVIICDRSVPPVSVWTGSQGTLKKVEWPWRGPGPADLYAECAALFDSDPVASGQRFEALARLSSESAHRVANLLSTDGHSITTAHNWKVEVEQLTAGLRPPESATIAAALQQKLIEITLELVSQVRQAAPNRCLCLGGSLFHHSAINTGIARSGLFEHVFVPIDPGNAGLAVGTALHVEGTQPRLVSPFLGPSYSRDEIKSTLDNCKLHYSWESEDTVIAAVVEALRRGLLVGWFEGRMEWGPRALGSRSIVANPLSPYVLENLNHFLKRREPWRGYALVGEEAAVLEHFDGPPAAPYMEHDYRPRDPKRFDAALPCPTAAVRVQTVNDQTPPRFRRLLKAFGDATGVPFLINTSFNAFREPIVCSPRDAVRVYYGSGLDMLVAEQFVLAK
jgi:carbamoyltransferase